MADQPTEKSAGAGGGGATPGKTLDGLSKEDLIKFSKKQAVSVSQMKAKLVDLQKNNSKLAAEKKQLEEGVKDLKRDSSRLAEENECLNQKLEGVSASFRSLVEAQAAQDDGRAEVKKLKIENQKLEDLLSELSVSLAEVERDKQTISHEMKDNQALLEDFQSQNAALKESVRNALAGTKNVEELRSELAEKSREMAELKSSLDRLEGLESRMDAEVGSWKLSFDECQATVDALKAENESLEEGKAKSAKQVEEAEAKIEGLTRDRTALEEKEAKLKTVAQKMKVELLRRREEDKNKSDLSLNQSIGDETEKDKRIESLEEEIRELKKKLRVFEEDSEEKGRENARSLTELDALRSKVADYEKSELALSNENSDVKSELEENTVVVAGLKAEIEKLKESEKSLSNMVDGLRNEVAKYVEEGRVKDDAHENDLDEKLSEIRRLEERKDILESEKRVLETKLEETSTLVSHSEAALRGKCEELSTKLSESEAEKTALGRRVEELSKELSDLQSENESLSVKADQTGQELGEEKITVQMEQIRRDLLDKTKQLEILKSEKENLLRKLQENEKDTIDRVEERDAFKSENGKLQIEVQTLRESLQLSSEGFSQRENEVDTLKSRIAELLEQKETIIEESCSSSQITELQSKISVLETSLERKNSVLLCLEEELSASNRRLEKEEESSLIKIRELQSALALKNEEKETLEGNVNDEEERSAMLRAKIEELTRDTRERDEKLDLIESEVDELQRDGLQLGIVTEKSRSLEEALAQKEETGSSMVEEEREQFKANIIVKEEKLRMMEKEMAEKTREMEKETEVQLQQIERNAEEKETELKSKIQQLEEENKTASTKLSNIGKSLEEEKSRHKSTYAKLENLKKTAQKKSVMHLEISDYEKTVDQLNRTIEEREKEKAELGEEIRHRDEKIDALTSEKSNVEIQREEESKRAEMIKSTLEKTKVELEGARDCEHAFRMREIETEQRMETLRQEMEAAKIHMTDAAVATKRNEENLSKKLESERRAYKALQSKYDLVEDELQHAQLEIVAVKEEMTNYKAKAQAVLKQAKSESQSKEASRLAQAEVESLKRKTTDLEAEVEALQTEVREAIDEADNVKSERDEMNRAHREVVRQLNAAEERFKSATKEWERENRACKEHYESSVQSLTERQTSLVESHRDKLVVAQEEFAAQLAQLQRVADSNEQEVFRLQKELQIALAIPSSDSHNLYHGTSGHAPMTSSSYAGHPLMTSSLVVDSDHVATGATFISSIERQEGEGMEHTDTSECEGSPTPSQVGRNQSFMPFDQLLSSPNSTIDATTLLPPQKHVWPTEEVTLKTLHDELSTASKKVSHLTELLRESEASNARLAEESKILKEEIRRSERNSNRQMELDNLEYLKNVIFKFLSFESDAEARIRLVPVMTMLLKLSPEEKQMLTSVANGEVPTAGGVMQANAAEGGGWSAYLHRWSGLM